MTDKQTTTTLDSTTTLNKVAAGNGDKPQPSSAQHAAIPRRDSEVINDALVILRGGQAEPREILELAKKLKGELRFGYARRLLLRASNHEDIDKDPKLRETVFQQLALCTYKDQDLPVDERLDRALEILRKIADFETTTVQETLGLIAAVYKRKWEIDNQRENLEQSLGYYERGYEQGPQNDQGYTGINAAYILDRLANLEEAQARKAGRDVVDTERREKARSIRARIVKEVGSLIDDPDHKWLNDKWWYYSTVAEAHFGLQNYDEAVQWIQKGQAAAGHPRLHLSPPAPLGGVLPVRADQGAVAGAMGSPQARQGRGEGSQGGRGRRRGASATEDNAARRGARHREPGMIGKTPPRPYLTMPRLIRNLGGRPSR